MSAIDPLVRISLPLLNPRGRPHKTLAVAPRRPASLQCSAAYPSDTSPAVFVRLRGVPINRAAGDHGGLLRAAIERDAPNRLAAITDQAAAAIAARFGDGPIEVPLYAIVFTAQRPAE